MLLTASSFLCWGKHSRVRHLKSSRESGRFFSACMFWFPLHPQEGWTESREVLLCFPAVITGQHRSGVVSARTRIDVLLDSFRKKQPFTHFLSFALNQPAIQEKFLQFKEQVLEKCSKVGIHVRIRVQSAVSFIERALWRFPWRPYSIPFPRNAFSTGLLLNVVDLLGICWMLLWNFLKSGMVYIVNC